MELLARLAMYLAVVLPRGLAVALAVGLAAELATGLAVTCRGGCGGLSWTARHAACHRLPSLAVACCRRCRDLP